MAAEPRQSDAWATRSFVAGVIGLGLAYLLPGHHRPWDAFNQQWLAAGAGALLALAAWMSSRTLAVALPWPSWCAFALAAMVPFQYLAGQIHFLADVVLPMLFLLGLALAVAAGADLGAGPQAVATKRADALLRMFWLAAMASTALATAQWLGVLQGGILVADLPPGGRPYANFGQVNHQASLLVLGLLGLWSEFERRRLGGVAAGLAAAWLVWGLSVAQSRTSWLALLLVLVWWWLQRGRLRLRLPVSAVVGLVLLLAAGSLAWEPASRMLLLPEPPVLGERLNAGPRSEMWLGMARAVGMSPWVGYGWNQVAVAHAAVATDHAAGHRLIQSAHSILLDLPLAVGLPVALVVFALAAWWLRSRLAACATITQWALAGVVLVIGTHALLEYPLEYSYFLLPFGLAIGWLEGLQGSPAGPAVPRALRLCALLCVVAMVVWVGLEYMALEESNRRVRLAVFGVGSTKAAYADVPTPILLDVLREEQRFMMTPARAGMTELQLNEMRKISQRYPSPPAMLRFALAAGLNDHSAEAAMTLRRLCRMNLPERCVEARQSWAAAQAQHPVLILVPAP